jgi:hypothetical protein
VVEEIKINIEDALYSTFPFGHIIINCALRFSKPRSYTSKYSRPFSPFIKTRGS